MNRILILLVVTYYGSAVGYALFLLWRMT